MIRLISTIFIGIQMCLFHTVHAQYEVLKLDKAPEYHIRRWTVENGLPQNSINNIIQTRNGMIWFTTYGGVVRYNGLEFELYDQSNSPELGSNRLNYLYEDIDGQIWITHEHSGLSIFKDNSFIAIPDELQTLKNVRITSILQRKDNGILYLGTRDGLYIYDSRDKSLSFITEDREDEVKNIGRLSFSPDSTLILSRGISGYTEKDIGFLSDDKIVTIARYSFPDLLIGYYYDQFGTLWMNFSDRIVSHKSDGSRIDLQFEDLGLTEVRSLFMDKPGNLWMGIRRGLVKIDQVSLEESAETIPEPVHISELSDVNVKSIFQDSEGNIWVGTDGHGLIQLIKKPIVRLLKSIHKKNVNYDPVSADGSGGFWVGTKCGGLFRYHHEEFRKFTGVDGCVGALFLDQNPKEPELWLGTNTTIGRIKNDKYESVFSLGGTFESQVNALYKDSRNRIWAGTLDRGVYLWENQEIISEYNLTNGLPSNQIMVIKETIDQTIWIGTGNGIVQINGESLKSYTVKDGLASGAIRSIHEDRSGTLWIGSYGGGLSRIHGEKISTINKEDGLFDNAVSRITEDRSGNLWMMGNLGLSMAPIHMLNDCMDGKTNQIFTSSFGSEEGMVEGNGGGGVATTDDGYTWWPTIDGIAGIRMDEFKIDSLSPNIYLSRLQINNQPVHWTGSEIDLSKTQRDFEVTMSAIHFSYPQKLIYRHKLVGYDKGWILDDSERRINYTNLNPGKYMLQVQVSNHHGIWAENIVETAIIVHPKLHETIWAKMVALLTLIIVLYLIYMWRARYLIARKKELENIVAERTKTLENTISELKEAQVQLIQSEKMASLGTLSAGVGHEINNPLNFIKGGINGLKDHLKKNSIQNEVIDKFTNIILTGVDRASNIVKSLSHFSRESEAMDEKCDLHGILDNCLVILSNKIKYKAEVEKEYVRKPLVLLGNEGKLHQVFLNILTNAIQAIEKEGLIKIKTSRNEKNLTVDIEDDGIGIDASNMGKIRDPFYTTKAQGEGTGLGLSISYEIIEKHGGTIEIKSEVGKGTRVVVYLPYS